MFNRIKELHRKLQFTDRIDVAPPTEDGLRVSAFQQVVCFFIGQVWDKLFILLWPILSAAVCVFWLNDRYWDEHLAIFSFYVLGLIGGSAVFLFSLHYALSRWVGKKLLDQFSSDWTRPLQGSDCLRAVELIEQLKAYGAQEYHAAVVAQQRAFCGFDLAVLLQANGNRQDREREQVKITLEALQQQACKTLHAIS